MKVKDLNHTEKIYYNISYAYEVSKEKGSREDVSRLGKVMIHMKMYNGELTKARYDEIHAYAQKNAYRVLKRQGYLY